MDILIPNELKDVRLAQYVEFDALPEDLNPVDKETEIIHIFSKLSRALIRKMSMKSRSEILRLLTAALGEEDHALVLTTELEGLTLGFVPNLDQLTLGEFVDLETYQKDTKDWDKVMRVLYRPVTEMRKDKYEVMSYEEALKLDLDYSKLSMDVVFGALVFFCDLGNDLISHILKSLKEAPTPLKHSITSELNGVGMEQYMDLLRATSVGLIQSKRQLCIKL